MTARHSQSAVSTATALAGWIAGFSLEAVPDAAVQAAKLCIADSLACTVGGMHLASSRILREVLAQGGGGASSIIGTAETTDLLSAAYLGGHAANALDFDDSFKDGAPSHPGATIIPPALALAEARDLSGADLLKAVIAAYEVSLRIGRAVDASPARKSAVMGFSTWQTFGAAVAGAALLRLSPERIEHAFGIAGAQAPLPSIRKFVDGRRPYSWVKNGYGASCQSGVLAALLAERDFQGNREIFDGDNGFWIMSGSDRYRPELALDGLGRDWLIAQVEFKPFSCCRWTHTTVEAVGTLCAGIPPERIGRIDVWGFGEIARSLGGDLPKTVIDAQFSARYVAALEIVGRSTAWGLKEADLTDPEVLGVAEKIVLHHEPAFDASYHAYGATPVRVVLTLDDGGRREIFIEHPLASTFRGGATEAQIRAKYLGIVTPVVGAGKAEAALDAVFTLESGTARGLAALLRQ